MIETASSPTPAAAPKETKAQRAERMKLAKNPWNAWEEVRQFAREGRASVLPEWAGMYFKWWGIYTQADGAGVTGGKGGEGNTTEYFMMRIGIPGDSLSHAIILSAMNVKWAGSRKNDVWLTVLRSIRSWAPQLFGSALSTCS